MELWQVCIGLHSDSATKEDGDDLSCRLVLRKGGAQTIQFSAYDFTESDKTASRKVHGLSFDLVAEEEIHVYLTTPHRNGTFAMCWTDAEKKVGIQAKHKGHES